MTFSEIDAHNDRIDGNYSNTNSGKLLVNHRDTSAHEI